MPREVQIHTAPEKRSIKPYEHHTRYSEADPQGFIHHACYINWMENARMNLFEQIGLGYRQMKDMEVVIPTLEEHVEHRSEVHFDDTIVVETKFQSYDGREMEVVYRIYDKKTGEDRARGRTTHCFMNVSGTPIAMNLIYPELETKFFEYK